MESPLALIVTTLAGVFFGYAVAKRQADRRDHEELAQQMQRLEDRLLGERIADEAMFSVFDGEEDEEGLQL